MIRWSTQSTFEEGRKRHKGLPEVLYSLFRGTRYSLVRSKISLDRDRESLRVINDWFTT